MRLKRVLAIVLSLCMTLAVVQLPAMAAVTEDGFAQGGYSGAASFIP